MKRMWSPWLGRIYTFVWQGLTVDQLTHSNGGNGLILVSESVDESDITKFEDIVDLPEKLA